MFQNNRLRKLLEKMLLNKKKPRLKIYFTPSWCWTASEQLDPYFRNLILQAGFCSLFVFVSLSSLMNFTVKLTKPWTFEIFQEWPITADIRMCEFSTKWQTNLSFFACGLVFACLIIKIFFLTTHAPEIFLVSAGLLVWQQKYQSKTSFI